MANETTYENGIENLNAQGASAKNSTRAATTVKCLPYELPKAEHMYNSLVTAVGMVLGYYDYWGYNGRNTSSLIKGIVELDARGLDGDKNDMDAFDTLLGSTIVSEDYLERFYRRELMAELKDTFVTDANGNLQLNTQAWNCLADYLGMGQYWRGNFDNEIFFQPERSLQDIMLSKSTDKIHHLTTSVDVPTKYKEMLFGIAEFIDNSSNRAYALDLKNTKTSIVDSYFEDGSSGFTFADFCAEIDAGRLVIIHLQSEDNRTLVGYGYDKSTNEIIFDDTYNHDCRMVWGRTYRYPNETTFHKIYAVTTIVFDEHNLEELPEKPDAPTAVLSTESWTNTDLTVSTDFTELGVIRQYSYDQKNWKTCPATLEISDNCTIYFQSQDARGNYSDVSSITITNIDKIAPTLTVSEVPSGEYITKDFELTFSAEDDYSGLKNIQYSYDNATWIDGIAVTISGNTDLYIRCEDNAGNITSEVISIKNFDKTAPVITASNIPEGEYITADFVLTFSAEDDCSEIALLRYSYDQQEWIKGNSVTISDNKDIYIYCEDKAGNSSTEIISIKNFDKTKPAITIDALPDDEYITADFVLNFSAKDNYSGVAFLQYSYDQQEWIGGDSGSVLISGNTDLYIRCGDYAGNITSEVISIKNFDKTAPDTPSGLSSINHDNVVTLKWNSSIDNGVSGISGYFVRYGETSDLSGEGVFTAGSELQISDLAFGNYFYQVQVQDNAGNLSDWSAAEEFAFLLTDLYNVQISSSRLSWDPVAGVESTAIKLSKNKFTAALTINSSSQALDIYNLPKGSYQWQSQLSGHPNTFTGQNITSTDNQSEAEVIESICNGDTDLFFAVAHGTWGAAYAAIHQGTCGSWQGTGETVALTGKNIINDFFFGSDDTNILVLTDDKNGDALFIDDVYTALPSEISVHQSRLMQINEIRAGAGNDVVDMTSSQFKYIGGNMTIYGGDGDDTIWANSGSNTLFGDAGNDRIIGGVDNDMIIGGAGNDQLHGGGGDDTFIFGTNWGVDVVDQRNDNGTIKLWFENNDGKWNADKRTYTSGENKVIVLGNAEVEIIYGNLESAPAGAFAETASKNIFESTQLAALA